MRRLILLRMVQCLNRAHLAVHLHLHLLRGKTCYHQIVQVVHHQTIKTLNNMTPGPQMLGAGGTHAIAPLTHAAHQVTVIAMTSRRYNHHPRLVLQTATHHARSR